MTDVLLIRHGESQSNAGLATPNPESVELIDKGHQQAREVSKYLLQASLIPDLIVTSSYWRTQQTALPLKFFLSLPEEQWPVHEFTYLSMWHEEISTVEDRRETVEAYWQMANPKLTDGRGSESFEQFIARIRRFKKNLERTELDTIAVFSHEQFIYAFVWLITLKHNKVTPTSEEMREFRSYLLANSLPNGGIVHAKYHKGYAWSFERITDHLYAMEENEPELALPRP